MSACPGPTLRPSVPDKTTGAVGGSSGTFQHRKVSTQSFPCGHQVSMASFAKQIQPNAIEPACPICERTFEHVGLEETQQPRIYCLPFSFRELLGFGNCDYLPL